VIDDVGTLTRWAGTFRQLAEVNPECYTAAGYVAAATHLERAAISATHAPPDADAESGPAPGRHAVDLRYTPTRSMLQRARLARADPRTGP